VLRRTLSDAPEPRILSPAATAFQEFDS